ncbi:DNA (cytosine-5)-methyltransferase 1 [Nitrosomonas cryotolerans]|uniref:DNA (cytosine-5-)-methyltransferase n=1 Tax=Nitrosomonas cryotolerans ATCC 49181 TaxID=1131553 RepID=A0A1N6HUC0_9PROT|nr:DNA cytosine methyltransferase [Nitrosomonas cryotolerans]SFP86583.1 DNA (cytosine-5)-methyltransferase 1 [Nitrosomonas cryotolerans]SIO23387.1 DNA (cytosine-5)-methyltransferase 1 [Nitrosomonas cryotolerans ATCC 49181]
MKVKVFDFFSGCGGTSVGMQEAGFEITFAVDIDKDATDTFKKNFPNTVVVTNDIKKIPESFLKEHIEPKDSITLFCGCAPCQPFSRQNKQKKDDDPRRELLAEFSRFVKFWLPDFVVIENVPGLQKLKNNENGPFANFLQLLDNLGYKYGYSILPAAAYGVPQIRNRLVLIASIKTKVTLPPFTHGKGSDTPYSTVKDWIDNLPPLSAGEVDSHDPDHQSAALSDVNLERIKLTLEGGDRRDWPDHLKLDCHNNYTGHSDVYGRLSWSKHASALTTRCISYSNGRFGHPNQDRAISIREAACLQTFPRDYKFCGTLNSKAKQIGNAVPPLMAQKIAEHIIFLLKENKKYP